MSKKRAASTPSATPPAANFIFRGTVQRAKASTSRELKADAKTAVVRVDEVIAAPPTLASIGGREVTVVLASGKALKPGQQAVFQVSGVSFGEDISVRATVAEPSASVRPSGGMSLARAAAAPLAATGVVDPVQAHRDLLLKQSLDRADVVVSGTITQVRMAPETQISATAPARSSVSATRRRAGAAVPASRTQTPRRISEHDPIWHEAVVNVESVEKGKTGQKQVVVRFPGSNDVRWRYYPKLRPGQQGVFLMSAETAASPTNSRVTSARATGRMTVLATPMVQSGAMQATSEPQPISAIERVRQLLNVPPASSAVTRAPKSRGHSTRASKPRKRARTTSRRKKNTR